MRARKSLPVIFDVRWTKPVRRAVASICSPAKNSVSIASALDGCSAMAVSFLQCEDKHPMPSYHWRETAVVLIDSMGYTLSFMRMPPQGIGTPHVSDEVAHFLRNGRTSRRTSPAELSPVISEPFLLPSQYSARLNDLQSILPAPSEARQPGP